jgi:hypothetical protein
LLCLLILKATLLLLIIPQNSKIALIYKISLIHSFDKSYAKNYAPKESKHEIIKRVHKFSIGKDFITSESDENNTTIIDSSYSSLKTSSSSVHSTPSTKITSSTNSSNTKTVTRTFVYDPSLSFTTPETLTKTTAFINFKLNPLHVEKQSNDIKKKLLSIDKNTDPNYFNDILNEALSTRHINYAHLLKGRSIEDTKAILNYMIIALYQINSKDRSDFDSTRFLDQVRVLLIMIIRYKKRVLIF